MPTAGTFIADEADTVQGSIVVVATTLCLVRV